MNDRVIIYQLYLCPISLGTSFYNLIQLIFSRFLSSTPWLPSMCSLSYKESFEYAAYFYTEFFMFWSSLLRLPFFFLPLLLPEVKKKIISSMSSYKQGTCFCFTWSTPLWVIVYMRLSQVKLWISQERDWFLSLMKRRNCLGITKSPINMCWSRDVLKYIQILRAAVSVSNGWRSNKIRVKLKRFFDKFF